MISVQKLRELLQYHNRVTRTWGPIHWGLLTNGNVVGWTK